MRPAAFLVFNVFGLLIIGGLLEAPRLAAAVLVAIGFALPAGLAYEVGRARLDRAIAVAAAWWSMPFVALLTCYLAHGGWVLTLASGLVCAGLCHVARLSIARRDAEAETEAGE